MRTRKPKPVTSPGVRQDTLQMMRDNLEAISRRLAAIGPEDHADEPRRLRESALTLRQNLEALGRMTEGPTSFMADDELPDEVRDAAYDQVSRAMAVVDSVRPTVKRLVARALAGEGDGGFQDEVARMPNILAALERRLFKALWKREEARQEESEAEETDE